MKKVEKTTDLAYIVMRNYAVNPETGQEQILSSENPLIAHIDHLRFFQAALSRIQPDGTINLGLRLKPVGPVAIEELSLRNKKERLAQCNHVAYTLRQRAGIAANYHDDPLDQAAYQEGEAAKDLARFRHDFDFLQEAAEIADTSYRLGLAANTLLKRD